MIGFGLGGAFTIGMTLPLDYARTLGESDSLTAFTLCVGYLIAHGTICNRFNERSYWRLSIFNFISFSNLFNNDYYWIEVETYRS